MTLRSLETWSLINETLNRNLKKQSTHEFLINDEMISDPIIIANKFNQYFAHIGSTLADKILRRHILTVT